MQSAPRLWSIRLMTVLLIVAVLVPIMSLFVSPKADAASLTIAKASNETQEVISGTAYAATNTSIASGSLPAGTYFVTWGAAVATSSANELSHLRLVRGTTELSVGGSEGNNSSGASNGRSVSGYWVGSLSGSESLAIEVKTSSTSVSARVDSKFIIAMRLDDKLLADVDYFSTGSQESDTVEQADAATGSWTTVKSLTKNFHASSSQDYIVLGTMEALPGHASNDCMAQTVIDGTAHTVQTQEGEDTEDVYNYVFADVQTIGTGDKTISLQGQSVGGATCDYRRSRIYVFRANLFDQVLESESLGESTSNSSTYSTKTTRAYTPNQSEDVMVIANHLLGSSAAATPAGASISDGTTTYADTMNHTINNATADYYSNMSAVNLSLSSAQTFYTYYKRNAGTGTMKIKDSRLIAWSMTLKDPHMSQGAYRWFGNVNGLGTEGAWWDASWSARRKITFDASTISENLTNFPVRVSLTSSNIDYTKTQNSGQDLRFTDGDGTLLKYEIETWNESGTSEVWVKVPQIDASSTTNYIYMYYDNSGASDGQDAANVWDSNFKTVLHLDESPSNGSAGHDDSTSGNHDGTPQGFAGSAGSTTNATGKISGADHFNPDNDYINITDHADFSLNTTGTYTWSAWVNPEAFEPYGTTWAQFDDGNNYMNVYVHSVSDATYPGGGITNGVSVWFKIGGGRILTETGDNTVMTGSQQLVTVTYDGAQADSSRIKIYVNGVDVTGQSALSGSPTGTLDATQTWVSGNSIWGEYFDGVIDESRYHTTARSAEWIEADYLSMNNSMNTIGGEETSQAWWNDSWSARRKITFNTSGIGENLIDFPVRVSLSSSNIDYSKTQNNGQDIRFVDGDGTLLKHEIETWNESGTSEVWVKIPQLNANSTVDYVYMYYGNSGVADAQDPTNVWESGFRGVLHMREDPSGGAPQLQDSTSYSHDGTSVGSMVSGDQVSGKVNGALDFDATDDAVDMGSASTLDDMSQLTVSAWIYPRTLGETSNARIAQKATATSGTSLANDGWVFHVTNSVSNGLKFTSLFNSSHLEVISTANAITPNAWQLVTVTWDGSLTASNVKIYVNGTEVSYDFRGDGAGARASDAAQNLFVGNNSAGSASFDGVIDEMRVANSARSADWIKAEYISGNNAMNSYRSEEQFTEEASGALTPLGSPNTAVTVAAETPVRLRQFIDQTQATTPINTTFKLQYAEKAGTCDTGFSGETFSDVPTSGTSLTFYDNPSVSGGASTVVLNTDAVPAGGGVGQTYVESNNFSNSSSALANGYAGLWDFALTSGTGAVGKSYCIRTVHSTGSVLNSYSRVTEISITGAGPPVPTTEQQMRHGQGVIDGVEAPLAL